MSPELLGARFDLLGPSVGVENRRLNRLDRRGYR